MVLQELSRGVSIIRLRRGYSRWHQADWFSRRRQVSGWRNGSPTE